jgi:hypothetical protein
MLWENFDFLLPAVEKLCFFEHVKENGAHYTKLRTEERKNVILISATLQDL